MQGYQHFPISVESFPSLQRASRKFPKSHEEEPFDERVTPTFSCASGYSVSLKKPKVNKNNEAREKSIRKVSYGQLVEGRYMIIIHSGIKSEK